MPPLIDLIGKRFGKLKVIRREANRGREAMWDCNCDCGSSTIVMGRNLRIGSTVSCGCYQREHSRTHGNSGTRIYQAWKSILNRCNGFTENTLRNYKNKGIEICDRWSSFENFHEDMGESHRAHVDVFGESNTSLDRIDGSKGYFPDNCRWATNEVQARNRKFRNSNPGVVFKKGKWRANIGVNGKQIHIGTFENHKDAVVARNLAEEKYWEE